MARRSCPGDLRKVAVIETVNKHRLLLRMQRDRVADREHLIRGMAAVAAESPSTRDILPWAPVPSSFSFIESYDADVVYHDIVIEIPPNAVGYERQLIAEMEIREQADRLDGQTRPLLAFDYVNWRGDDHHYLIEPEGPPSFELGPFVEGRPVYRAWCVSGSVIERDGVTRSAAGTNRRTFAVDKMRDVQEVER